MTDLKPRPDIRFKRDEATYEKLKALYLKAGMKPHDVDKVLLKNHDVLKYNEHGNVLGIDPEAYKEALDKFTRPPEKKHDYVNDIQMLAPDGIWESFNIMTAFKWVKEKDHIVSLRRWKEKEGQYVELDSYYLNNGLRNQTMGELNDFVCIMPEQRAVFQKDFIPTRDQDLNELLMEGRYAEVGRNYL